MPKNDSECAKKAADLNTCEAFLVRALGLFHQQRPSVINGSNNHVEVNWSSRLLTIFAPGHKIYRKDDGSFHRTLWLYVGTLIDGGGDRCGGSRGWKAWLGVGAE